MCGTSSTAVVLLGVGKILSAWVSSECELGTVSLALHILCLVCLGEADGAYHYPALCDEPEVTAGVGEPPEYPAAYGDSKGIVKWVASLSSEVG